MHTIRWTLSAAGLPGALRRCACCSEMRAFFPTDMFRVNANGRRLDVFLIYKCEACQKTWNMEVVSRVRPEEIAPDTYRRYLQNDPEEAACCASDPLLWQKNRMRLCEARLEDGLAGESIDLRGLTEPARIEIEGGKPTRARLDRLLCGKLGISREAYRRMARAGALVVERGALRSGGGALLVIRPEIGYDESE